jgi:hypothetical protein
MEIQEDGDSRAETAAMLEDGVNRVEAITVDGGNRVEAITVDGGNRVEAITVDGASKVAAVVMLGGVNLHSKEDGASRASRAVGDGS